MRTKRIGRHVLGGPPIVTYTPDISTRTSSTYIGVGVLDMVIDGIARYAYQYCVITWNPYIGLHQTDERQRCGWSHATR